MAPTPLTIADFNALSKDDAVAALMRCCGAKAWAEQVAAGRPYADLASVHRAAEAAWGQATREQILEAFSHHPRVGDVESLRKRFPASGAWSEGEQGGLKGAGSDVLTQLAAGNTAYEARFGFIFLICATGKTAPEMLAALNARLPHAPDAELAVAAAEQGKITRLRLEKLFS
jgi:2-oxo-4-hydroxy-4-carboxy-5-ureidoimidazoline decarboxylase